MKKNTFFILRLAIKIYYYIIFIMINKDPSELLQILREKCSQNNLKLTPQRIAIFEVLSACADHPSADNIYQKIKKRFPSLSFDTVNRTLLTFAKIGITKVVEGRGDPKRFDPNLLPHHHFRCTRCGSIEDIFHESFDRLAVPESLKKHYLIHDKKVVLEGLCQKCQKALR